MTPLDELVADLPLVAPDKVCSVEWDYRLPECLKFNWQQYQNPVSIFADFSIWLAALDFSKVVSCRSGGLLPLEKFMSQSNLNPTIFHQSPLMVADPFELEHNVTGQISSKNLEKIVKILRAFQIRFKMNRFLGKFTDRVTLEKLRNFQYSDYTNCLNKPADETRDWGLALLLIDDCEEKPSPTKSTQEKTLQISAVKAQLFYRYMVEVMRATVDQVCLFKKSFVSFFFLSSP